MAAGTGPSHRPLDAEEALLRDMRATLIAMLEALNSEARGITHLRSRHALNQAVYAISKLDRARADYTTPLGDQPLLQLIRATLAMVAGALESEQRATDPNTPIAIHHGMTAVGRIERALNAYAKG